MKKSLLFAVMVISLLLAACFSPWSGDEAVLTVTVGGSGSSRALLPLDSNNQPTIDLTYELILEGTGRTHRFNFTGSSATVKVPPGRYNITVRANTGSTLRALGEKPNVTLRGGKVRLPIDMYGAREVTSWVELASATAESLQTHPVTGDPRKEIILLRNGSDPANDWKSTGVPPDIQRPIIIRAVEQVTIKKGVSNKLFKIVTSGHLTLEGDLTLDGNNFSPNSFPLIEVSGGELIINNGVTLRNNNNTSATTGGAVRVTLGKFTMNGGTISGNETTTNGGGVYVNGGVTFIMNGGTISGNTATTNGGGVFVSTGGFFRMINGTIYGIDEPAFTNNCINGAAISNNGTATYGLAGASIIDTVHGDENNTIRAKDGKKL